VSCAGAAALQPAAFVLLAARAAPGVSAQPLLQSLRARGAHVQAWSPAELARRRAEWQRRGIEIDAAEFAALADAGKALLVPPADEHRFLPPGADPLKTF
jgi:hypothetical protein